MKRMPRVRETVGRGREEERRDDRLVHFVLRGNDGSELNNQGVMKTRHHIVPESRGGNDSLRNIIRIPDELHRAHHRCH